MPLHESKDYLFGLYRSQEKTLNWTDLDYWSSRLKLDIPLLKRDVDHLIAVHPYVTDFLLFAKHIGKMIYLVTNAHSKTLDLKLRKTRLGSYFCGIVSAHDIGIPKEVESFWARLRERIPFEPERTLLAEDSESNLQTAFSYGIKYLVYVSRSSSTEAPVPSRKFVSIHYFSQLIPQVATQEITLTDPLP
jgi:putative hydrolase of the HAD superfamily